MNTTTVGNKYEYSRKTTPQIRRTISQFWPQHTRLKTTSCKTYTNKTCNEDVLNLRMHFMFCFFLYYFPAGSYSSLISISYLFCIFCTNPIFVCIWFVFILYCYPNLLKWMAPIHFQCFAVIILDQM